MQDKCIYLERLPIYEIHYTDPNSLSFKFQLSPVRVESWEGDKWTLCLRLQHVPFEINKQMTSVRISVIPIAL